MVVITAKPNTNWKLWNNFKEIQ